MAFVDIFNYKKYFSSKGDSNVARIGHVNKLATRVTSPTAVTQSSAGATPNSNDVTINSYAGVITMATNLAPLTTNSFTVSNSFVTSSSVVLITIDLSGNADLTDGITYTIDSVVDGSFDIGIRALSVSGSPIKIHFLVIS